MELKKSYYVLRLLFTIKYYNVYNYTAYWFKNLLYLAVVLEFYFLRRRQMRQTLCQTASSSEFDDQFDTSKLHPSNVLLLFFFFSKNEKIKKVKNPV